MKLSQKALNTVVFSKQLQQSLKILQMNSQDLTEFINQEIQDNPFLLSKEDKNPETFSETPEIMGGYRYEKAYNNQNFSNSDNISQISTNEPSLFEAIENQINIEFINPKERIIALKLAEHLDDNGYLQLNLKEFSKSFNIPIEEVNNAVTKLKKLEPSGIFAENLADCLIIQLKDLGLYNSQFIKLIENMKLIAQGEIEKLCKVCDCSKDKIIEMISTIKSLNPKPGSAFNNDKTRNLIPDIFVAISPKNEVQISLNTNYLNPIAVNTEYYKTIMGSTNSEKDRKFCTDKLQSANWLVKSIKQRSESLIKIATAVAEEQMEFFKRGVMFLKPMRLADIAKKTDLHESSVSRISNKVIGTNFGVFEIKYFFSSTLKSNYTENTYSSSAIKAQIKKLVSDERETQKILSDDQISQTLQDMGIKISRRTVTKYREAMKIEPSNIRKRKQKLSA